MWRNPQVRRHGSHALPTPPLPPSWSAFRTQGWICIILGRTKSILSNNVERSRWLLLPIRTNEKAATSSSTTSVGTNTIHHQQQLHHHPNNFNQHHHHICHPISNSESTSKKDSHQLFSLSRYYPSASLGLGPDAKIDEKSLLEVKSIIRWFTF